MLYELLKLFMRGSFAKLKFLLKQFTSIAVAQLEECEVPPSKLTADLILSAITAPYDVRIIYFKIFFIHYIQYR
jgi:hypothetical protein